MTGAQGIRSPNVLVECHGLQLWDVMVGDQILADVEAKIALGAVAPCVIRSDKAESILKDKCINDEIISEASNKAAEETSTISDLRSTAEYRQEMVSVLVERAMKKAATSSIAI